MRSDRSHTPPSRRQRPRRLRGWAALVATLVAFGWAASPAGAYTYYLSDPKVQRQGQSGNDYGYRGPTFFVATGGFVGTGFPLESSDTYICPDTPRPEVFSNLVVVGDDYQSEHDSWTSYSVGSGNSRTVHVANWTLDTRRPTTALFVAASCTDAPGEFPLPVPWFLGAGRYQSWLDGQYPHLVLGDLIERAFCWNTGYPGCGVSATQDTHGFALHDGVNTISTVFRTRSSLRPPAIRMTGAAGCAATQDRLTGQDGADRLHLVLACDGLAPGASLSLRASDPVRVDVPLHHGSGTVRTQLAKPPGTAGPLLYLGHGPDDAPCASIHDAVRVLPRKVLLRINARCGEGAGNTVAHLYVGGLLG